MISAAVALSGNSMAYTQVAPLNARVAVRGAADVSMAENNDNWKAAGLAAALALATGVQSASAGPFTRSEIQSLTYEQIKGTGLANTCPKVEAPKAGDKISVAGGKKYRINE